MSKVNIIYKNFYTNSILEEKKIDTNAVLYSDLIRELNSSVQEVIIFSKRQNSIISENNEIIENDEVVLFNADGGCQCGRKNRRK